MALTFNGSTQICGTSIPILSSGDVSISAWVNVADLGNDGCVFYVGNNSTVNRFSIMFVAATDTIKMITHLGTAENIAASTGTVSLDTWHHAGGKYTSSGTTGTAFLDGANKGTDSTDPGSTYGFSDTFIAVLYTGSPSAYFDGIVAEIGIWDIALPDSAFAMLGKAVSPLMVYPQSLIAYYPLWGRSSLTLDIVGKQNMSKLFGPTVTAHPRVQYPYNQIPLTYISGLLPATIDFRNRRPVLDFNDTLAEYALFSARMPSNYTGNGIDVHIYATMTSATSGKVRFSAQWEKQGNIDTDMDNFAEKNYIDGTAAAVSGHMKQYTIRFSDGADMGNVSAEDYFRLRINREASDDTVIGDAEIHAVELQEF